MPPRKDVAKSGSNSESATSPSNLLQKRDLTGTTAERGRLVGNPGQVKLSFSKSSGVRAPSPNSRTPRTPQAYHFTGWLGATTCTLVITAGILVMLLVFKQHRSFLMRYHDLVFYRVI